MIRAVIDTNVLVSALISRSGNEALIILAVTQGLLHAYASSEILLEYAEVLARPKFSFQRAEVTALLDLMRDTREIRRTEQPSINLPDPDDHKFLVCARAASAEFIVTGNKRHFPQEICNPIQVVNASELLDRLTFGAS